MSDEALAELSAWDLIALIRRLEEQLVAVTTQLTAAQARNAELEAERARRSGPPKTPQNSSTPPSKGWKREEPPTGAAGAKRGRPVGHPGTSRRRTEPDWVVLCQPTHCADCGANLAAAPQERVGTSQVVELPPVQPVVLEAWRYAATCAQCGATTTAAYPAGFEPTRVFGPHLEALWTYLHEQHHVSYARLATLGWDLWHLAISQGALANARRRVATRLQSQAAAIREQVRASPVINSDETGARVEGDNRCHWVFPTPTASYHLVAKTKGAAVIAELLGFPPEDFEKIKQWSDEMTEALSLNPGEDRQQVPATIIASKRMKFVNHHYPYILEEVGVVDLGRNQHGLKRLRGREQAVRRIGDDLTLFTLGSIPVPASRPSADQLEVAGEAVFLVVQESLDRADVQDRQPFPGLREHLRKHGKEQHHVHS